jgi:hypothetical protein
MIAPGEHDDCSGKDYDPNADRQTRKACAPLPFLEYNGEEIAEQDQHYHVNGPAAECILRTQVNVPKVIEEELPVPECSGQHCQQVIPRNTP